MTVMVSTLKKVSFSKVMAEFEFIDLFAGIGGMRLPFEELGGECVFTSEWDKFAQQTYRANFGEVPAGDITLIASKYIPDHDLLLAGFPCQAFSQAGLKKGFNDTRGTMFFEIERILRDKRPKAFLLENVKQLKGHDKGKTLRIILETLESLGYWVDYKVLRAADFGIPQNRERLFIVGFNDSGFSWPVPPHTPTRLGDILEDLSGLSPEEDKYTISAKSWIGHVERKERHKSRGRGFGYSLFHSESEYTNSILARYYKDGSEILIDQGHLGKLPRKLTPRECARLQGFPEDFRVNAVSHGQIYKQFGNSVCVAVIRALAIQMVNRLEFAPVCD